MDLLDPALTAADLQVTSDPPTKARLLHPLGGTLRAALLVGEREKVWEATLPSPVGPYFDVP
jgi:hypothetical protein